MLFATRFFFIRIIVFLEIAGNFTFTILWLCIVSLLNLSAYCCFFDLNFYTMKFSMFSIFRSRSLLASFFSISHVASFVNYFFSSFFVSSLGSSAPCDSLSILPNLPLPVNRFFCFFHLFSTFTYYPVFIIVIRHE